jgi:glycosyltransferase involved in cell wall biosynthesis
VVIPIFNRQISGERAVLSARGQVVDGMEIIVVDDGSDPPFRLPLEMSQDVTVRLIRHETNSGASVARNSGISAARGEWIALLDSDDYWLPATLQPRLAYAKERRVSAGSAPIAYAAGFVVKKGDRMRDVRIPREPSSLKDFVSGCWFAPGSTIVFRKEVFERIGPWDSQLLRLEDYDWFLRFALAGGRLRVWDEIAAITEVEGKPSIDILEATARRLLWKYGYIDSLHALPAPMVRRLRAMLDVERASIWRYRRQWIKTFFHLARSFARVPRLTIHLSRFWVRKRGGYASSEHPGKAASRQRLLRSNRVW